MHPRNRHQGHYDLQELARSSKALLPHIIINKYGSETIDFADPEAVKALNQAILKKDYGIEFWDLPSNFLCPPIPGRADYIHFMADLISKKGPEVRVLDIGVGANCIYPLIGHKEYGWSFVGSDVSELALTAASRILESNKLKGPIELRKQESSSHIFEGIIAKKEKFDFTLCNPPFHESQAEAMKGTMRKNKNLGIKTNKLNFGGKSDELWCRGGELGFITLMIEESSLFRDQSDWFSSLVSKENNLPKIESQLRRLQASEVKVTDMSQGHKQSRIVAWKW